MLLKRLNQDLKENMTESEGMDKGIPYREIYKKNLSGRLISDKTDFKPLSLTKDKVGHYLIKRSIKEATTTANINALNRYI